MKTGSDGSTLRNEFEVIHTRRRLVMEYPISPAMRITTVILDFKDVSKGESMPDCAAMLVPTGMESDWLYSSEGGQWQLLASAGVMRLILFSRAYNTLHRSAGGQTENASYADAAALLEDRYRKTSRQAPRSCGPAKVAEETPTQVRKCLRHGSRSCRGIPEEREAEFEKGDLEEANHECADRRKGLTCTQKNSHPGTSSEQHLERKGRYEKIKERQQLDSPVPCLQLPLAESLDDDTLKLKLRPLALALAPKGLLKTGVQDVPYVDYVDSVLQRVVVEEAMSPFIGLMRVEDVELESDGNATEEQACFIGESNGTRITSGDSPIGVLRCSKRTWRRRLIFKRMPNLIQTEVLLNLFPQKKIKGSSDPHYRDSKKQREARSDTYSLQSLTRLVDHSKLVHKYLPPIVAGLVLVSPCLDAFCKPSNDRAKIFCVGVGGGALPIFLRKNFPFRIQVVELDEVVLHLARKHFGLKEDAFLEVTVGDGLIAVEKIAAKALEACLVDESLRNSWTNLQGAGPPPCASGCHREIQDSSILGPRAAISGARVRRSQEADKESRKENGGRVLDDLHGQNAGQNTSDLVLKKSELSSPEDLQTCAHLKQPQLDPRVHLIILDVDACDSQLELNSPPRSFLEARFLLSVRIALQSGGMLAINVVPAGRRAYEGVINSLRTFFPDIYEIDLQDDLNRIVFALPSPVCLSHQLQGGETYNQIKHLVGEKLVKRIQRIDGNS